MDGRERVLAAARTEFAARGYAGTSVRDIVARAGMTAPALYHHFGSKAGVYQAVAAALNDRILETFETAVAGQPTFAGRLLAVIEATQGVQRDEPDVASFVMSLQHDVARYPELAAARPELSRLTDFAERIARDGRPDGLTQLQAVRVFLTLFAGLSRMAVVESPREYATTVDALAQFLVL